jgi:hypothetical protein
MPRSCAAHVGDLDERAAQLWEVRLGLEGIRGGLESYGSVDEVAGEILTSTLRWVESRYATTTVARGRVGTQR